MLNFNEIIASVITAVLLAGITIVFNKVTKWINTVIEERELQIDTQRVNALMGSFKTTLTQAIIATNQTYVNDLKAKGKFDSEAATEAMRKTVEYCMTMMASDVITYLEDTYTHTNIDELIIATAETIIGASKDNTSIDVEAVVGTIVDYLVKLPKDDNYTVEQLANDIRNKFGIPG